VRPSRKFLTVFGIIGCALWLWSCQTATPTIVVSAPTPNPSPSFTSMSPSSSVAGGASFNLAITGVNFVPGATVLWNGSSRTTTFVNSTQLTAAISATDIAAGGVFPVTVSNPSPGGGVSAAIIYTLDNPTPILTTISPSNAEAGGAGFTLTVTGSDFVPTSVVQWSGSNHPTTFVSGTQLTATIPASDIAVGAAIAVGVSNPGPAGGSSGTQTFMVTTPPSGTFSLSPAGRSAGAQAFNLTVNGTNFSQLSSVLWNGSPRVTTLASSTQLVALITAADVANGGTAQVSVSTPGVGTSPSLNFAINGSGVVLNDLVPFRVAAGSAAFSLVLNGAGFTSASTVRWNGSNLPTTFVSSTQLTAAIPASDLVAPGFSQVTVTDSGGGGSSTDTWPFLIGPPGMARFAYVLDTSNNVLGFSIDSASGGLTRLSGSPFPTATSTTGASLTIDRLGRFLYVSVYAANSIFAFSIDSSTGGLTSVPGSPFPTLTGPSSIAEDPTGRFIYVAFSVRSGIAPLGIAVYTVNSSTGALTVVGGSPFLGTTTGGLPSALTIGPSGRYLYAASPTVSLGTYALNSGAFGAPAFSAGLSSPFIFGVVVDPTESYICEYQFQMGIDSDAFLTLVPARGGAKSAFWVLNSAFSVALHPSGKFVYAGNSAGTQTQAYTIDLAAKTLTAVLGSPFTGGTPSIEPTGQFLYSLSANTIITYTIDPNTGFLTAVAAPPVVASNAQGTIVFSP